MHWILVWVMVVQGHVVVHSIEFNGKAACDEAKAALFSVGKDKSVVGRYDRLSASYITCVSKGKGRYDR